MEEQIYYKLQDEYDSSINIDLRKILLAIWNRKILIIKVFICTLIIFIISTYTSPKVWKVEADLYINKSNNSNMMEVNPYVIDEMGTMTINSVSDKVMMNELELIQSPLVIDKVIKENNLKFKKLFGIFPTVKTGEYLTTEKFLKKKVKFENKKGTSVISISYKSKEKDETYGVVSSIITNYIELHKELNNEKSKSDKKVIEAEYKKAKEDLNKKVSVAGGLPTTSMSGTGNLAAMSAFSRSAQNAMANLRGQYREGEKARVEITEESTKVAQLANKLEWARLVEEMSDSSKVLVIKEPKPLRDWEYASPKLFTNILLGIVFGVIFSLIALIYAERTDKKLSYSMLGDNIIYDLNKENDALVAEVMSNINDKKAFIFFEDVPTLIADRFKQFKNTTFIKADISNEFTETVNGVDSIVIFACINRTDSEKYKLLKKMITNMGKKIIYEVLV